MADVMQSLNHFHHKSRVHNGADAKDVGVIDKYASDLENAVCIGIGERQTHS